MSKLIPLTGILDVIEKVTYLFKMSISMNIVDRFSSSLDQRDQGPNEVIAQQVADENNLTLLGEVIQVIHSSASVRIKNDAVMVLMALSRINAAHLKEYVDLLVGILTSKSNRQVFGGMIALANVTPLVRDKVQPHLSIILEAMDRGTVVTRDHGFTILTELYQIDQTGDLLALIHEQLLSAPPNQVGQYTEKFMAVVKKGDVPIFIEALEVRSGELTNEHHRKRLGKNMKKLRES